MIDAKKNILISRQAAKVIPVEVVLREYMAKSATSTSVYHNYVYKERRNIYGIDLPDGLLANQRFPMGPILTPTTKADEGHDLELDENAAQKIADETGGEGTWDKIKVASGELMLVDELYTSDSSRIWKADSYEERFEKGETPQTFDKEILRRWLSEHGYTGKGKVPVVDKEIIDQMVNAYRTPFQMLTGVGLIGSQSADETRNLILSYFSRN